MSDVPEDRLIAEVFLRKRRRRLQHDWASIWTPEEPHGVYPWQAEFCNAGAVNTERLLIKANRVGGTT